MLTETPIACRPQPAWSPLGSLSCIRLDEVLLLQGPPLIGAIFSLGSIAVGNVFAFAATAVGSVCLVAHVFVFNDWSGIHGDLKDPNRAARVFITKGVRRTEIGYLAIALLILSLVLFGLLGVPSLVLALAIAGLSALYSAPVFNMKGFPLFNSVLHFIGGSLHFLLGYATFAAIDERGLAISSFFGLVFTAGHLTHEARDREGDLLNNMRTNAVVFGKTRSFVTSLALFTVAYGLLVALAVFGTVPRILVLTAALYPLHLYASLRALRAGLTFESLCQLQSCYRLLFAVIGISMVVAVRS